MEKLTEKQKMFQEDTAVNRGKLLECLSKEMLVIAIVSDSGLLFISLANIGLIL